MNKWEEKENRLQGQVPLLFIVRWLLMLPIYFCEISFRPPFCSHVQGVLMDYDFASVHSGLLLLFAFKTQSSDLT